MITTWRSRTRLAAQIAHRKLAAVNHIMAAHLRHVVKPMDSPLDSLNSMSGFVVVVGLCDVGSTDTRDVPNVSSDALRQKQVDMPTPPWRGQPAPTLPWQFKGSPAQPAELVDVRVNKGRAGARLQWRRHRGRRTHERGVFRLAIPESGSKPVLQVFVEHKACEIATVWAILVASEQQIRN